MSNTSEKEPSKQASEGATIAASPQVDPQLAPVTLSSQYSGDEKEKITWIDQWNQPYIMGREGRRVGRNCLKQKQCGKNVADMGSKARYVLGMSEMS